MITAIFGIPGSGKSIYAEAELSNIAGKVLYVGTLPRSTFFAEKLREHCIRRPSNWQLFELTDSWTKQGEAFQKQLLESDFALIEGLSHYVYRQIVLMRFGLKEVSTLSKCFEQLHEHSGTFFMVDQPIPVNLPSGHRRQLLMLQNKVIELAQSIVWVDAGQGVTINRDEVRPLLNIRLEEEAI